MDSQERLETREGMLSVGHFGALCGVSRQTLIFYDRLGIFCPAYVAKNGYRYYKIQQAEAIGCIMTLRDLGMTLEAIKEYLTGRSPERCQEVLENQRVKIRNQIERLERVDQALAFRMDLTRRGSEALIRGVHKVVVEKKPAFKYLSVRSSGNQEEDALRDIMALETVCQKYNKNARDALGVVIRQEDIRAGQCQKIYEYFVPLEQEADLPGMSVRPAGSYAVIHHQGAYEKTQETYVVLQGFLKAQGLMISGDSFETGVHDYFTVPDASDYLTVFEVPVKRSSE